MSHANDQTDRAFDAASLFDRAREAGARAYAPYSGFRVGAALLDVAGVVHTGANVENASYGLATCAERVAVTSAVGGGARSFVAIAVASPDGPDPVFPCGACRQILHEFTPGIDVVVASDTGPRVVALRALLPEPFDAEVMDSDRGGPG